MEWVFFPQNKEYVNTTELVQLIAKVHGKDLKVTRVFNPLVKLGIKVSETFNKVFGSFVYDKKMPGGLVRNLIMRLVRSKNLLNEQRND